MRAVINKPLMGIIPIRLGPLIVEDALDVLVNNGISAFCIDFGGSTITSKYPDLIEFYKLLKDYGLLESSLMYSINASYGRISHKRAIIEAKDIVSFEYGFDVLGRAQTASIPQKVRENISSSLDKKLRIFNKSDYGYYRVIGYDISSVYPSDSNIPLDDLFNVQQRESKSGIPYLDSSLSSVFNMEQQGLEALSLRRVIQDEETEQYVKGKKHLDKKDKQQIFSIHHDIKIKQHDLYTF